MEDKRLRTIEKGAHEEAIKTIVISPPEERKYNAAIPRSVHTVKDTIKSAGH